MTPLIQFNRKLQYLFIALLLAGFAFAQSGRAVAPNGTVAEEETADPDVGTGEANAATLLHERFRFNFPRDLRQCAIGNVTMGGELVVAFHAGLFFLPASVEVAAFNGAAENGNRELRVERVDIRDLRTRTFDIRMIVTGPALPGGEPLRFLVLFGPNAFRGEQIIRRGHLVWSLVFFNPDRTPHVTCLDP